MKQDPLKPHQPHRLLVDLSAGDTLEEPLSARDRHRHRIGAFVVLVLAAAACAWAILNGVFTGAIQ